MIKQGKGSALEKALLVLDVIIKQKKPVSLAHLVDELELGKPTVQRLLQQLETMELIQRSPERTRYWIGPKLNELSTSTLGSLNQAYPSRAILETLVDEIGESSNLGVLDQHEIQYIERVEPNYPLRFQLRARRRGPIHCTAIGKLLFAYKSEEVRKQLISGISFKRYTENTIINKNELEQELEKIRQQGYSVNNEEYLPSLIAVSVPVMSAENKVIAGVSVHASITRVSLDQAISYLPKLQEAAKKLSVIWTPGAH